MHANASIQAGGLAGGKTQGAGGPGCPVPPKILFLVAEDWYFLSHRLPLARAALRNSFQVTVATRVNHCADQITREGFHLIPLPIFRESFSVARDFRTIYELRRIYESEKPDIVHHVGLKPVLYGSIAALGIKNVRIINALAGLGYLATS